MAIQEEGSYVNLNETKALCNISSFFEGPPRVPPPPSAFSPPLSFQAPFCKTFTTPLLIIKPPPMRPLL